MKKRLSLCAAGVIMIAIVSPGSAQEGASLAEVETFMAQGRVWEARETLETWWTTRFSSSSRSDRERGIWLRGKLTVDPSMAELDYRRLVLEFPGGPYSDDALFRMGLSAELRGELRDAQAFFEALIRDYPASPRVPEARSWISHHTAEIAGLPPPRPRPDPVVAPVRQEEGGDFSVQLGAFRSLGLAGSLANELRALGYEPRVVRTPGNELARVRIGRFGSRDGAEAFARELEGKGFDVTLVFDAGSEEPVGGGQSPGKPLALPGL